MFNFYDKELIMLEGYINDVLADEKILAAIPDGIYIILALLGAAAISYAVLLLIKYSTSMLLNSYDDFRKIFENADTEYNFFGKPHINRMILNVRYYMKSTESMYSECISSIAADAILPLNRIGKSLNFIRISAPLFGLSGTIIGLKIMFATGSINDSSDFMSAVAVALNTTFLGALIAILTSFIQTRIYSPRVHIARNELETAEKMINNLQNDKYSDKGNEIAEIYISAEEYHSAMARMLLRTIETTENITRQFERVNTGFEKQAQAMTGYYNLLAKLQAKTLHLEKELIVNDIKIRPAVAQVQSEREGRI